MFSCNLDAEVRYSRHVAAGSREACDEPGADRISRTDEDDGDTGGRPHRGAGWRRTGANDEVGLEHYQFHSEGRQPLACASGVARLVGEILAFGEDELPEPVAKDTPRFVAC